MQKFNLVQKGKPGNPDEPKKWYAVPQTREAQSVKAMTRSATENTSTAPIEMEAALDLLGKYASEQLLQGHTVKVGDLGTLRITFKSDGVANINDFNAGVMIKTPYPIHSLQRVQTERYPATQISERRRAGRRCKLCLTDRLPQGKGDFNRW